MINNPSFSERLFNLSPVFGTWNTLGSFAHTEILATSGLDFQIFDFEHGIFSTSDLRQHVVCSNLHGCCPLVRFPEHNSPQVSNALDQGIEGLIVPHIRDAETVFSVRKSLTYPPSGTRGFSPYVFSNNFGLEKALNYDERKVCNPILVCIIESLDSLNNFDFILDAQPDVIYFGAYDLSVELGYPGKTSHPSLLSLIKKYKDKTISSGIPVGGFVPKSIPEVHELIDSGFTFITYLVDSLAIINTYTSLLNEFSL